jgi:hypothetical protein
MSRFSGRPRASLYRAPTFFQHALAALRRMRRELQLD